MPDLSILIPDGVNQRAIVILSSPPPPSPSIRCTLPLPKLLTPTILAALWSRSAPAIISLALALPLSIRTIVGKPLSGLLPLALSVLTTLLPRRSDTTTVTLGNHRLETSTAPDR